MHRCMRHQSCEPGSARSWARSRPGSQRPPSWQLLPVPGVTGRAVTLGLELLLASVAALAVYVTYSWLVRLPELPRTIGLLRSALRPE